MASRALTTILTSAVSNWLDVRLHEAALAGDLRHDLNARAHDRAQHVGYGRTRSASIEHLGLEGLPTGEGKELSRELGGTLDGVGDCVHVPSPPLLGEVGPAQQVGGGS